MIGAGLAAAVGWNLVTLVRLGLPSSSGNALVGGLVGAALVEGGLDAVQWAASTVFSRWESSAPWSRWRSHPRWALLPRCS